MADTEQAPKDLFGFLDFYLVKKAPFQIPDGGREFIVKFGPWIALFLLVFVILPVLLFALGLGTLLLPFMILGGGVGAGAGFGISALLALGQTVLLVVALPGLFARKVSAWRLMVYSSLVGIVGSLLSLNLVAAIVGGLIGLYILFQIRTKYHE